MIRSVGLEANDCVKLLAFNNTSLLHPIYNNHDNTHLMVTNQLHPGSTV